MAPDVYALKVLAEQTRGKTAGPLIEVAEDNPGAVKVPILQDPITE
jgi:hypothetical protein